MKRTDEHLSNWPYTSTKLEDVEPLEMPDKKRITQAVVLGLGSMFNHSTLHQNTGWERNLENQTVVYTTLRDVKAGEELCISYGSRLTFRDVEAEELAEADREDEVEVLGRIELF